MERTVIAVVNDSTGELYAVAEGYENRFHKRAELSVGYIKVTRQYGEFGENIIAEIFWNGFKHYVDSTKYSFIYE